MSRAVGTGAFEADAFELLASEPGPIRRIEFKAFN